jgi:hypothetical protein
MSLELRWASQYGGCDTFLCVTLSTVDLPGDQMG